MLGDPLSPSTTASNGTKQQKQPQMMAETNMEITIEPSFSGPIILSRWMAKLTGSLKRPILRSFLRQQLWGQQMGLSLQNLRKTLWLSTRDHLRRLNSVILHLFRIKSIILRVLMDAIWKLMPQLRVQTQMLYTKIITVAGVSGKLWMPILSAHGIIKRLALSFLNLLSNNHMMRQLEGGAKLLMQM